MRPELTPLPVRMQRLPLDQRGYPIPRFVSTLEDGTRDFRIMDRGHWIRCVSQDRCWVCDAILGAYLAFVAGPMCGINRISSEPPCHRECAEWSAMNCPFLARPHMVRREDELTDQCHSAGVMIKRNPGVAMVWITKGYKLIHDPGGEALIRVGEPYEVLWYAAGRAATRAEVEASIESGFPTLLEMCESEAEVRHLQREREKFTEWLPK